jgi:hypothetical protein
MILSSPTDLSDEEKLETLRRLDQFRPWRSLAEKRYCLVCGKIITGQEIKVIAKGPLRVICPSDGCHSIPMDWALPTDEILATAATVAVEDRDAPIREYRWVCPQ